MLDALENERQLIQEGQSKERVIELNEWFTPFENYHEIPYEDITNILNDNGNPATLDSHRLKKACFHLANVGRFETALWWKEYLIDPNAVEGEKICTGFAVGGKNY